jgi:hypothetical protein
MQIKSESLDIGQLRRSYRGKKLTAVNILEVFGRGFIRVVKETVLVATGGLILFCLIVGAMMVDIEFGRLVLIAVIILGVAFLGRAIAHWFGGGR